MFKDEEEFPKCIKLKDHQSREEDQPCVKGLGLESRICPGNSEHLLWLDFGYLVTRDEG